MALTDAALNTMADALAAVATKISLHSGDPGSTGANETTAARQTPAWTTPSVSGDLSLNAPLNFTGGAANGAVLYFGLWNGATFLGGFQIPTGGTNDLSFNAAGEYTLDDVTIAGT